MKFFLSWQEHLDNLQQFRGSIATAAQKCENSGSVDNLATPDTAHVDSPLSRRADEINTNLNQAIVSLEGHLARAQETVGTWESVERLQNDLAQWLAAKQTEVQHLSEKPAKLHVEAAQLELQHLQVSFNVECLKVKILFIQNKFSLYYYLQSRLFGLKVLGVQLY